MKPCDLLPSAQQSTTGPYYYPEDGGSTVIGNVNHYVSNGTVLQPGKISGKFDKPFLNHRY
jgi:hypothetical protein